MLRLWPTSLLFWIVYAGNVGEMTWRPRSRGKVLQQLNRGLVRYHCDTVLSMRHQRLRIRRGIPTAILCFSMYAALRISLKQTSNSSASLTRCRIRFRARRTAEHASLRGTVWSALPTYCDPIRNASSRPRESLPDIGHRLRRDKTWALYGYFENVRTILGEIIRQKPTST